MMVCLHQEDRKTRKGPFTHSEGHVHLQSECILRKGNNFLVLVHRFNSRRRANKDHTLYVSRKRPVPKENLFRESVDSTAMKEYLLGINSCDRQGTQPHPWSTGTRHMHWKFYERCTTVYPWCGVRTGRNGTWKTTLYICHPFLADYKPREANSVAHCRGKDWPGKAWKMW
jgi:hypothetical protein